MSVSFPFLSLCRICLFFPWLEEETEEATEARSLPSHEWGVEEEREVFSRPGGTSPLRFSPQKEDLPH